jgi:SAM-dependent methyltransferase
MEEAMYYAFASLELHHWWFVARIKILHDIIDHWIKLSPSAEVLDVGCGTGAFLASFPKYVAAIGIDTSETALELCRKKGITNVYKGSLDSFPLPGRTFDLITLLDVIEHIDDDIGALHKTRQLLKSNGHILVTVPAFQFLWSKHDEINHHKRRYTSRQLRSCLEAAGFSIQRISYFNTLLFPGALLQRLLFQQKPRTTNELIYLPTPIINSIFSSVFSFERYLLRVLSLPFGLSILAAASPK